MEILSFVVLLISVKTEHCLNSTCAAQEAYEDVGVMGK